MHKSTTFDAILYDAIAHASLVKAQLWRSNLKVVDKDVTSSSVIRPPMTPADLQDSQHGCRKAILP